MPIGNLIIEVAWFESCEKFSGGDVHILCVICANIKEETQSHASYEKKMLNLNF
jgi:hypothetical protein